MNVLIEQLGKLLERVRFFVIIRLWERGVRLRRGKNAKVLEPGFHWCIPIIDEVMITNTRLRFAPFPVTPLMTADGRAVSIAGMVFFCITDPLKALMTLAQPEDSCSALAQASITDYITARAREEIDATEMREAIREDVQRVAGEGFRIEAVGLAEYVHVSRAYRLIGDGWQPQTRPDLHDKAN